MSAFPIEAGFSVRWLKSTTRYGPWCMSTTAISLVIKTLLTSLTASKSTIAHPFMMGSSKLCCTVNILVFTIRALQVLNLWITLKVELLSKPNAKFNTATRLYYAICKTPRTLSQCSVTQRCTKTSTQPSHRWRLGFLSCLILDQLLCPTKRLRMRLT